MTFCKNNSNLIEYYLPFIKRDGIERFKEKYQDWLMSDERIDYTPSIDYNTKAERKKIYRERKKAIRKMQNG